MTREISEVEGDTPMTEVGGGQRWEMRNSIKEDEEDASRNTQPSRTVNAETL